MFSLPDIPTLILILGGVCCSQRLSFQASIDVTDNFLPELYSIFWVPFLLGSVCKFLESHQLHLNMIYIFEGENGWTEPHLRSLACSSGFRINTRSWKSLSSSGYILRSVVFRHKTVTSFYRVTQKHQT